MRRHKLHFSPTLTASSRGDLHKNFFTLFEVVKNGTDTINVCFSSLLRFCAESVPFFTTSCFFECQPANPPPC
jgi:hypothetical protein